MLAKHPRILPACSTSVLHCLPVNWGPAMSTTTIRLPDDLKQRIAVAAKRAGTTAHGFILEAIAEKADEEERRSDFHHLAETRYAAIAASGKTIRWSDMRAYLESRVAGKQPRRPSAKKLAR